MLMYLPAMPNLKLMSNIEHMVTIAGGCFSELEDHAVRQGNKIPFETVTELDFEVSNNVFALTGITEDVSH